MKKLLSIFLVAIMSLSCFGLTSFAEDENYLLMKDGIIYSEQNSGEIYVSGYNPLKVNKKKTEVVIPETIKYMGDTYVVKGVDVEAFISSKFSKITLPATVDYIGDGAFSCSADLREVIIPDECYFRYFGYGVFAGTMVEETLFDGDTAVIGQNVLYAYIGNAKKYVLDKDINVLAGGCFMMSPFESVILHDGLTEIPTVAFANCRKLKSIKIPDSVETIGMGAFKDCINLKSVDLGEGVKELGVDCFTNTQIETAYFSENMYYFSGAFSGCDNLRRIYISDYNPYFFSDDYGVYQYWNYTYATSYGNYADGYGLSLELYYPARAKGVVTLNEDVTFIEDYAFRYCDELKKVNANEINYIGIGAFKGSSIEEFNFTGDCTIRTEAFSNCTKLKSIDISSAAKIDDAAFINCTSLKKVTFCENIFTLGAKAFANSGLEKVEIGGLNTVISEGAFMDCKNLKKVTLKEGVSSVCLNAFLNCPKLETISLSYTIDKFYKNALNGCDNVTFEVVKNTAGHRTVKKLDYNFEIVGRLTFIEEIKNFFDMIYDLLFGWIEDINQKMYV